MSVEVQLKFYSIDKCGYYHQRDGSHQFCNVVELLNSLRDWATSGDKLLRDTKTFDAEEDRRQLPVYFVGLWKNEATGDFLLSTWNETHNVGGTTHSIRGDNKATDITVDPSNVRDGNIPGFASYYWLIPEHNVLATVRFPKSPVGRKSLNAYLTSFLQKFSPHAVHAESEHGIDVTGYKRDATTNPDQYRVKFSTSQVRRDGPINHVKDRRLYIKKIVQKSTIKTSKKRTLMFHQRLLRALKIQRAKAIESDVRYKIEIDYTPDELQLNEIIQGWEDDHETKWDDVGFVIAGDSSPTWLSHVYVSARKSLDVHKVNSEMYDCDQLLRSISDHRLSLLASLKEEE